MKNQCQLITYPDSLGNNLADLQRVLETSFHGLFGGVHILPFYPSSADRGFAPTTYEQVDPAFGSWRNLADVSRSVEVVADFMLNHISRESEYFRDFLEKKDGSKYRDFFIRYRDFWPGGEPSEEDLAKIYTRKPRPPYYEAEFSDGTKEKVWCTFDYAQIDLNMDSPVTLEFIRGQLEGLCRRGVKMIRLDAFAYATKRPGTPCFFLEPEVWRLLEFAASAVRPWGVELLPEVHEHYTMQQKIASHGYRVYDFALPFLVLAAVFEADASYLLNWLRICPRNQVTTLDTHDGIGVVDVKDLLPREVTERTKAGLFAKGAGVREIYSSAKYANLDIYQINCTYYSALGEDDSAYLLARAIQFFAPGIPQVYYVGLLAGRNDIRRVEATRVGRDINRHGYSLEEIDEEIRRPVVQALFQLMRFRNTHPAFDGELAVREEGRERFVLSRISGRHHAELEADLKTRTFVIRASGPDGTAEKSRDGADIRFDSRELLRCTGSTKI